jgi:THO complex subunit 2
VKSAEDAEKRLKAALAAKREPFAVAASAETNGTGDKMEVNGASANENGATSTEAMEVDGSAEGTATAAVPEVAVVHYVAMMLCLTSCTQAPWLPELQALFDDLKNIAPGNAYEMIGCVCELTSFGVMAFSDDDGCDRPGLYTTFWQMSSYDLFLPKQKYLETERQLKSNADSATRTSQSDRYLNATKELRKERAVQELVYAFTTDKGGRLDREKSHWLGHGMLFVLEGSLILTHCKSSQLVRRLLSRRLISCRLSWSTAYYLVACCRLWMRITALGF